MNAVSLFAGVGGFDLALERNGIDVVASVEIDKHALKVLARHFPKSTLFTDVKEVTGAQLIEAGFTPDNGIIVGGFRCQDVSVAGRRAGLTRSDGTHTRSGLFWEVVRILDETKAKYFILENVPGLLPSNDGRDFGTVIGALDELGYGVSWRILDAQYFGVPQRRRRIFIVGCLGDSERASEILALSEGRAGYLAKGEQKGKATAGAVGDGSEVFSQSGFAKYTGGVMPLTATNYKRPEDLLVVGSLQARDYKGVGNQYVAEGKLIAQKNVVRRLTPIEFELLQGFPRDWTEDQADSHRYKQMGNAVAVPVVEFIVKRLVQLHTTTPDDLSGTDEGEEE